MAAESPKSVVSTNGPFKPGDLIVQEEPWMHCLDSAEIERRCYYCMNWLTKMDSKTGKITQLLQNNQCSGCKTARYCSLSCQKTDWAERHKFECSALRRIVDKGVIPPNHFTIMLKIVSKLLNPKTDRRQFLGPREGERTFWDLMAHMEDIKMDSETMNYVVMMRTMIGASLKLTAEDMARLPFDEFLAIFGKIKCNTFVVEGSNWETIGIGIYIRGSAFDHCCKPNSAQTFVGKRLSIRATREIPSISQVRISYVDPFEPRKIRREKLLTTYHFLCGCEACMQPKKDAEIFALKCVNPSCDEKIPSDERANQPCPKCGTKGVNRWQEFERVYGEMIEVYRKYVNIEKVNPDEPEEMRILERKLKRVYHPENPLWPGFYIKKGFCYQHNNMKGWPKCFQTALDLYRPWLSPVDPRIGWCAYFAADPSATGNDKRQALKFMDEAQRVLSLTFGPEHEMTTASKSICVDLARSLTNKMRIV